MASGFKLGLLRWGVDNQARLSYWDSSHGQDRHFLLREYIKPETGVRVVECFEEIEHENDDDTTLISVDLGVALVDLLRQLESEEEDE